MTKEKKIIKIVLPREKHWVGDGFYVSSIFSMHSEENKHISPFLLLDHAAPTYFPPTDKKLGVGEHPHRGFETVTMAIKGEVEHRDSSGGGGKISTGGVQWMTAGSGVVHDEFHSRDFAEKGGEFEMVQLWVNLPAKNKMTKPRYQSLDKKDFPIVRLQDGTTKLKIIAGNYGGLSSPTETFTKINIYEVEGHQNSEVKLNFDDGTNTLILQLAGSSIIGDQHLDKGYLGIFSRSGVSINLKTTEDSKILILNGEPIEEPLEAYGPFVMNTREELKVAFRDFQEGKMGSLTE
ncbi:MAG: pirin family protein [Rhodobacteraceae bacterium]|nr:pirin family protein [Paracoccaceae bacterium]